MKKALEILGLAALLIAMPVLGRVITDEHARLDETVAAWFGAIGTIAAVFGSAIIAGMQMRHAGNLTVRQMKSGYRRAKVDRRRLAEADSARRQVVVFEALDLATELMTCARGLEACYDKSTTTAEQFQNAHAEAQLVMEGIKAQLGAMQLTEMPTVDLARALNYLRSANMRLVGAANYAWKHRRLPQGYGMQLSRVIASRETFACFLEGKPTAAR